jgi:hypothetical protein
MIGNFFEKNKQHLDRQESWTQSLKRARQRFTPQQWQSICWQQIKKYQAARNHSAKKITNNVALFQTALDFYEIGMVCAEKKQDTYQVQLAHRRWYRLLEQAGQLPEFQKSRKAFNQKNSTPLKGSLSSTLNHHRQASFASYPPEVKKWKRLLDRYEKMDKQHQEKQSDYYLSQRDKLAAKLLAQKEVLLLQDLIQDTAAHEISPYQAILVSSSLCFETIAEQTIAHEKRSQWIKDWCLASKQLQAILGGLIASSQNDSALLHRYVDWAVMQEEVSQLSQRILQKPLLFEAALRSQNLMLKHIQEFEKQAHHLKSYVLRWLESQEIPVIEPELTVEQKHKICKAQKIEAGTQAIAGTLAEQYLREHRGIQCAIPDSYRYHPALYHPPSQQHLPTLVVIAKNSDFITQAVQAIYLDPSTAQKAAVENPKLTYGVLSHGKVGVCLRRGKSDTILIAEGPETALSIQEAHPSFAVFASLGVTNFARVPISANTQQIIFCADNDGKKAASQVVLKKAADGLAKQGVTVWIAKPEGLKQDFNDVLKKEGVVAIQKYLQQAVILQNARTAKNLVHKTQQAAQQVLSSNIVDTYEVIVQWAEYEKAINAAQKRPLYYINRAKREQQAFIQNLVKDAQLMQQLSQEQPAFVKKIQLLLQVEKEISLGSI